MMKYFYIEIFILSFKSIQCTVHLYVFIHICLFSFYSLSSFSSYLKYLKYLISDESPAIMFKEKDIKYF